MKSTEIQAAFAALLETFEPITGQPTDEDLTCLKSSILQQVVPIPFDTELGEHNLMGLILTDDEYTDILGGEATFPAYLTRPKAYPELKKDITATSSISRSSPSVSCTLMILVASRYGHEAATNTS